MPNLLDWLVDNEPLFRKSRLPSLYSDLAVQKTTNPEGYAANVTAWQSALTRATLAGQLSSDQTLILHPSEELLNVLASPQYGRPSGLGLVLDESVRSGKMMDMKNFMTAEASIYQSSWVPSPWSVLRWGLKQAGLTSGGGYDLSGRLRSGQLVVIQGLEELYKSVVALQNQDGGSLTDRVMSREDFSKRLAKTTGMSLSTEDVRVLLCYLHRDKRLLNYDNRTVKMKSPSAVAPEPITSEDTTIATLKDLIVSLEREISTLEKRVTTLQTNAQEAVRNKNRLSALSALKSKKLAETTLTQRTSTLHQLEEVYSKIEQAVDQVQIVEAMQASTGVLRSLNKRIGGAERVEDVVEDLREQMAQVDEVGQVLQEPLDSNKALIDEVEVDEELEAMEREEQKFREEAEAEVTRKKFEEADRASEARRREKEKQDAEAAKEAEKRETEQKLNNSIDQLGEMSLQGKETRRLEENAEQAS